MLTSCVNSEGNFANLLEVEDAQEQYSDLIYEINNKYEELPYKEAWKLNYDYDYDYILMHYPFHRDNGSMNVTNMLSWDYNAWLGVNSGANWTSSGLDFSDDIITFGSQDTVFNDMYATTDFSVSVWLYSTEEAYNTISCSGAGSTYTRGLWLYEQSGSVVFSICNGVEERITESASNCIPAEEQWYLLSCTFDRDGYLTIYIDGEFFEKWDISGIQGDISTDSFVIGRYAGSGVHDYYGYIDDLVWWNKLLTSEEVQEIYNKTEWRHQ